MNLRTILSMLVSSDPFGTASAKLEEPVASRIHGPSKTPKAERARRRKAAKAARRRNR